MLLRPLVMEDWRWDWVVMCVAVTTRLRVDGKAEAANVNHSIAGWRSGSGSSSSGIQATTAVAAIQFVLLLGKNSDAYEVHRTYKNEPQVPWIMYPEGGRRGG